MPRRSKTDEPRPEEQDEAEVEVTDGAEVGPLVEDAPVSAAARHNARYDT